MIIVFTDKAGNVTRRRHEVGVNLRGMRLDEVHFENAGEIIKIMENPKWVVSNLIPAMRG